MPRRTSSPASKSASQSRHLLVVEDRESLRKMLERALTQEGYRVTVAPSGEAGVDEMVAARRGQDLFDLVITDLKLPGMSGLEVLKASKERQPQTPVLVLTAYGTVATAVEAMRLGATDFLEKPLEIEELFALVGSLLGHGGHGEDGKATDSLRVGDVEIVGRHTRLRSAVHLLRRVAPMDSTVLLTGESGTGKEVFARALHELSERRDGPFVAVNCAAIPESLMENELFGHEKGAFTGADRRQKGRFEVAEGGTLLLDEIGELSAAVQSKVLRVLEERSFERVGGGASLRADVRLVAATNRDLKRMVNEGSFRSDLFYRLDVFPIELPALRERASDVPLLARHLLRRIATRLKVNEPQLAPEAGEFLSAQPWPGNVRQLSNVLERAVILADGGRLEAADLRLLLEPLSSGGEREKLDELKSALLETDGDKQRAAEILGVGYRTVQRRIKDYDLEGFPKYRG